MHSVSTTNTWTVCILFSSTASVAKLLSKVDNTLIICRGQFISTSKSGVDRMPSIAKKILWKKYKKHLLSSFQDTKSTQTTGSAFAARIKHFWTRFFLFWFKVGCAWLWLAEKFLQKWRWFFFFKIATPLSGKAMCSITVKQHNCWFLVLKTNIQNVSAGFALFTIVETSHFIGWNVNTLFVSTCWTVHISDSISYFVVHTQFFLSVIGRLKWDIKEQLFVR